MAAQTYNIKVEGELGPRYAAALQPLQLHVDKGTTTIVGDVRDQAQLMGLLEHLNGLGIAVVSINPVNADGAESARRVGP